MINSLIGLSEREAGGREGGSEGGGISQFSRSYLNAKSLSLSFSVFLGCPIASHAKGGTGAILEAATAPPIHGKVFL